MSESVFDHEKVVREWSQWLFENGAGGFDEWHRPAIISVPEEAGWENWLVENRRFVATSPVNFTEPLVYWAPPNDFSKTRMHQQSILGFTIRNFNPFKPQWGESVTDWPVAVHIHPDPPRGGIGSCMVTGPDVYILEASVGLEAVVAMGKEDLHSMAIKGPEFSSGYTRRDLQRSLKKAGLLKEISPANTKTLNRAVLSSVTTKFGEETPYDCAFYVGKHLEIIDHLYKTRQTVFRRVQIQGTKVDWYPLDEADPKLEQDSFRYYKLVKLGNFF